MLRRGKGERKGRIEVEKERGGRSDRIRLRLGEGRWIKGRRGRGRKAWIKGGDKNVY